MHLDFPLYHSKNVFSSYFTKMYQYLHCILNHHNFERQYSQLNFDFRSFQLWIRRTSCHLWIDDVIFWRNNFMNPFIIPFLLKFCCKLMNFR